MNVGEGFLGRANCFRLRISEGGGLGVLSVSVACKS